MVDPTEKDMRRTDLTSTVFALAIAASAAHAVETIDTTPTDEAATAPTAAPTSFLPAWIQQRRAQLGITEGPAIGAPERPEAPTRPEPPARPAA